MSSKGSLTGNRRDEKIRGALRKLVPDHLSICEAVKITIHQARISYVSTHNMEMPNL
jgi:hypothetical protein